MLIMDAPTVVPDINVGKKGKWIEKQNPQWKAYHHDMCSICGWWNTKNAVCRDDKKKAHKLHF